MTAPTESKFHFSPRRNRAHEIAWREWGGDAFAEAKTSDKPVLLSLSAVWCHWCHVMDETSYSNAGVIDFINAHYIPIRVDNDQRPDINARYNMGGWPTTAFLTPDGEILAGATYVPPDQMLELLPRVNVHYKSNRDELNTKVMELRERRSLVAHGEKGELSPAIFQDILRNAIEQYDPVYGGFGEAPKFPHADAIDLLMYAYRRDRDPDLLHMARKTLEYMSRGGVYDHEWGGFFRYSTRRDWSEPHYEKMLEDNANLLKALLALYRISGDEEHARAAIGTIEYVSRKLHDPDRRYFYGSQDADEEFYKLDAAARGGEQEPYIDRTCYVSWNAMMASAYLEASWTLGHADARAAGLAALDFAWNECRDPAAGMYRFHDGQPHQTGLLGDQAHMARALLDAHEVTGDSKHFHRALELAALMSERFLDRDAGGFYDVWDGTEAVGRLGERQKSVQDNTVCAEVFLRLHHLTREAAYRETALRTLEAFVSAYPQMGYFASGYARQVDTLLNPPVEINVVGDVAAAASLHRAALALDAPSRVVQVLEPAVDGARLEALLLPPGPAPAAYVCFGTACSAPVIDPEALTEVAKRMRDAVAAPQ